MKLDIRTTHYDQENTNLKGFATVKIDDKYVLENIQIRKKDSGELFVALPTISRPVKENGEIVMENGKPKKEYFSPFHPITADARSDFFGAILERFEKPEKEFIGYEIPGNFNISKIKANPYEKNNIVGLAKVGFGDAYILENIVIKSGSNGEYLDLPSYRVKAKDNNGNVVKDENGNDKFECKDMFHPITADAQAELRNSVVSSLNAVKQQRERAAEADQSQGQNQSQGSGRGR